MVARILQDTLWRKRKALKDFARNKEKRSMLGKIGDYTIRYFNCRRGFYNDYHEILYSTNWETPIDFTLSFFLREEDGIWYFDLRSNQKSTLVLGELAKKFGGGGHPHAAGFTMKYEEGLDFLKQIRR